MFDELTRRKKHGDRTEHWVREKSKSQQANQQGTQFQGLGPLTSPFYYSMAQGAAGTWVTATSNTSGGF